MKCVYCDKDFNKHSLRSFYKDEDLLCDKCRNQLMPEKKINVVNGVKITSFFEYEGLFKDLLLQYKECYDEALKDVFLYDISEYLKIRYLNYEIMFVPSSKERIAQRGFNHLEEMFKCLNKKEAKGIKQIIPLSQHSKSKEERKLMYHNYAYNGPRIKKLLIVDDVVTTGNSILGVYEEMSKYSDKIKLLSLSIVKNK